jgi:allophanate hydrolase subunit 1
MELKEIPNKIRNMEISLSEPTEYNLNDYIGFSVILGKLEVYAEKRDLENVNRCIEALESFIVSFEDYNCFSEEILEGFRNFIKEIKKYAKKQQFEKIVELLIDGVVSWFEYEVSGDLIDDIIADIQETISEELEYLLSEKQQH